MTDLISNLLATQVNTQSLETVVIPVPVGLHAATTTKWELTSFPAKEAGKQPIIVFKITYRVSGVDIAEACKRDNPTVMQTIFLNLSSEGEVTPNNVGLGRYLEATEGKDLGEVSLSEAMDSTMGIEVAVTVKHKVYEEEEYAEVKKVQKIEVLDTDLAF